VRDGTTWRQCSVGSGPSASESWIQQFLFGSTPDPEQIIINLSLRYYIFAPYYRCHKCESLRALSSLFQRPDNTHSDCRSLRRNPTNSHRQVSVRTFSYGQQYKLWMTKNLICVRHSLLNYLPSSIRTPWFCYDFVDLCIIWSFHSGWSQRNLLRLMAGSIHKNSGSNDPDDWQKLVLIAGNF
jgi:hypothetical protein